MLAEEDSKFLTAVNACLVGRDVILPTSGVAQYVGIAGGITRDTMQDAFKVMPRTPSHLEVHTVLINNVNRLVFQPRPRTRNDGKLIILFPGGLQWHQGLDIAIRAFRKLSEELHSLHTQRDTLRQRLSEAESHLAEKQSHLTEAQSRLSEAEGRLGEAERRLMEAERRLAEAEHRLAEAPKAAPDGQLEEEEFRRRYELALEDLREVKARNAELQQQLASARSAAPSATPPRRGVLDWEAEKQRILAALESQSAGDDGNEEARAERLKIEEVVRKTDAVLAAKDREIAELKGLLANQSGSLGVMAVGAAAVGEVLDKDAIVQEERENLKRLQEECREKLRQAEIELSLDRAKLARQRAELEEKLRAMAPQESSTIGTAETADKSGKPPRGRWLARLGLKDLEKD
jgi:chromosome segregation ATPase